ncbi:unnamed protein product [Adineta steineri]|uniref:RING-type domain-containing protein n=1 Tax=Adineta steineri TaxID=433720 RepID=A0A815W9J6_9BILA|nr:unnamed protein product [Adineta steineri]CAF1545715.1 unnamed protein product [Adineta steineri]CAF1659247.1 unnamed protein product [Adineta steineri]
MSGSEEATDLDCPICLSRFNDPIILSCGHTMDRLCIQKLINYNRTLNRAGPSRCPVCNWEFNPEKPLISNKSLSKFIESKPIYEWFLIDILCEKEGINAMKFLKLVFNKRHIIETNHITFETNDTQIEYNSNINFDEQLHMKPFLNLNQALEKISTYSQQINGIKKICILSDGFTKHTNMTKIDSNMFNQLFLIHVGDKYIERTRQLANETNFQFGHFNEKKLEIYVQHFLTNFTERL